MTCIILGIIICIQGGDRQCWQSHPAEQRPEASPAEPRLEWGGITLVIMMTMKLAMMMTTTRKMGFGGRAKQANFVIQIC